MKEETEEEIIRILGLADEPLTTKAVIEKIKDRCPDSSVSYLVQLKRKGVVDGKLIPGRGYVWSLRT